MPPRPPLDHSRIAREHDRVMDLLAALMLAHPHREEPEVLSALATAMIDMGIVGLLMLCTGCDHTRLSAEDQEAIISDIHQAIGARISRHFPNPWSN